MKKTIEKTNLDFRILNPKLVDEKPYRLYKKRKEDLGFTCNLEEGTGFLLTNEYFENKINSVATLFIPYLSERNYYKNGKISIFARGKDYHIKSQQILKNITAELKNKYPNNSFHYQCDIGKINERFYAGASGLCTIGINGNLIHDQYGSYGNIALIYSDLITQEYKTKIKHCPNCGLCKEKCPSKAIYTDGINNSRLCISYLTQKKEDITKEEKDLLKKAGYIFGCDICQKICPLNKNISYITYKDEYIYDLDEKHLETLKNNEFRKKYKDKAFSWRGKGILLRNIKIINDKS